MKPSGVAEIHFPQQKLRASQFHLQCNLVRLFSTPENILFLSPNPRSLVNSRDSGNVGMFYSINMIKARKDKNDATVPSCEACRNEELLC